MGTAAPLLLRVGDEGELRASGHLPARFGRPGAAGGIAALANAARSGRPRSVDEVKIVEGSYGSEVVGMASRRFEWAIGLMRKHDPQLRGDGFDFLREHADSYVDEIIAEFEKEQEDRGLRCRLLELLAEARSPQAMPVLVSQLQSDDESLRDWAVRGLEMLDTREAHQELHRARSNGWVL